MHSSLETLPPSMASPPRATAHAPPAAAAADDSGSERGMAKLVLDFRRLFGSESVADVILDLEGAGGQSDTLPAHRIVLMAGSSYFASMFSGAWEESSTSASSSSSSDSIRHIRVISDESLPHLRTFFAFLYGCEVALDLTCTHPLLRLADFYGVDALMTQCLAFLERVLHPQPTRCFTLFEPSTLGSAGASSAPDAVQPPPQERLIALCTEVLARSFSEASVHAAFGSCPEELLVAVLERDDLSVDREAEVLHALIVWAEADRPRRMLPLARLISLVRWPLLDGAFLADVEDSYPILAALAAIPAHEINPALAGGSSSSGGGGGGAPGSPFSSSSSSGPLAASPAADAIVVAASVASTPPDSPTSPHADGPSSPSSSSSALLPTLRELLLEAFRFQAASDERRASLLEAAQTAPDCSRRLRPRTPNMVRLQGEGKFCWSLKNFSRLAQDERIYSPPFVFSGIAFMLLFFPRGNQQREYASLYVSVADKTKLPPGWRRDIHFSLSVIDQRESLCSVTKSTHGELTAQVLDWGFTELLPLATLHSSNHGYILDDSLQFTIQFERITEGGSVSGRGSRASASTPSAALHPLPLAGAVAGEHLSAPHHHAAMREQQHAVARGGGAGVN